MSTWIQIPVGVVAGCVVAIGTALFIAARELGGWRAIRLQFVINNQSHKRRQLEDD